MSKKQTVTSPTSINLPTKAKRSRVRTKSGGIDRSISDQSESELDVPMQTEDHAPADGTVDDCVIVGATASRTNHHSLAQQGTCNVSLLLGTTAVVNRDDGEHALFVCVIKCV